jgi:asparagine synthase (glutamine-hydrolysing)
MPGIVGLITKKRRECAEAELNRMVDSMRHESFYVSGTWIDERLGVYVGWVARKGAFEDGMPVRSEDGNLVLVLSGEEFPEPGLRSCLRQKGHAVNGEDDASYLVHVAETDPEFPRNLNGRFQGLLVNRIAGSAMLFNDRFGMHRVYIHEGSEAFYFAGEAKAILAVRPDLRSADTRSLGEFVACGCVLENRTLFRDIQVLPGASAWTFTNSTLERKDLYFNNSEWENQSPLDPESYYTQLREAFASNLPRYFTSRERIGISLTGGLDTRMIMAWANATPGSLPGYTFGGPFRDCHDVIIGRKVAEACHQPYQIIPIGSEFLARFPHYAERAVYLTDGCVSVNRGADLYANKIAAGIAPVRMTGNYGSEILRRLRAFKPSDPAQDLFRPEFLKYVEMARQTYNGLFKCHAVSFTAFCQAPWYQFGLSALEQTQLTVRSPFLDNDVVRTAFRAPGSEIVKSDLFEDNDACGRLIADGSPTLHRIPTDRGLGGQGGWTAPFRRGLLEFTFKAEYAYDYGMPQWLARIDHQLAKLHPERLFLGRHKFCHFRVWYRDSLSSYVREMLLDPRSLSRSYIQPQVMESMVSHHMKGDRNYTTEITRLLTLEIQHRLFID